MRWIQISSIQRGGAISSRRRAGLWKFVNNSIACNAFEALLLAKFLSKMSELYSVTEVPVEALLMFPFIYLCKQGFSVMFCMKTKFFARLHEGRPPHLLIQLFSPNHGPDFDQTSSALTLKLLLEYRFLSYVYPDHSFVYLINKMCINELSVECCFIYNSMSLQWGTWPIVSKHGVCGEKKVWNRAVSRKATWKYEMCTFLE